MIEIVSGDLLEAKEKYIGHICNCVTQTSAGIAQAIFDKYPYSNTYSNRTVPDIMGTIKILGNGRDERFVINMFAQYYPGKSKYPLSKKDGMETREKAFHKCLLQIARISELESIAMPFGIGCGLAGGNWPHYLGTITHFTEYVYNKYGVKVVLYKLDD